MTDFKEAKDYLELENKLFQTMLQKREGLPRPKTQMTKNFFSLYPAYSLSKS